MLLRIVDSQRLETTIALVSVCEVKIRDHIVAVLTDIEIENLKDQVTRHAENRDRSAAIEVLG